VASTRSRAVLSPEAVSTPPAIWTKDRTSDQPGVALESGQELAVSSRFEEWRAERVGLLESRLQEIDAIASAGKLAEAVITAEGLSISPIRKDETDESEGIARRLYGMLPRLRITELGCRMAYPRRNLSGRSCLFDRRDSRAAIHKGLGRRRYIIV